MTEEPVSNQRAPRFVRNPSGYHSHGKTHKEKVFNLGKHIKQFGWEGSWEQDVDVLKATMKRGESESIIIWWPDDQWWPDVTYNYAGSSLKCRNISHAAKIASEKPDASRMRKSGRRMRSKLNGITQGIGTGASGDTSSADELISEMSTTLPFDKESTPEEIRAVIKTHINPTLIWVNRLTGRVESDIIKTWSRHLKVTKNKDGKTIIHFVGMNCFHAVYVDSVIGVS